MSKQDTPQQSSRRRLLKGLTGTGSLLLGAKTLPEQWTKPLVDSVVLPAHAQLSPTTFTITCVGATPPDGLPSPEGGSFGAVFQITPNPGVVAVLVDARCDGVIVAAGGALVTAADGSVAVPPTPSTFGCTAPSTFSIRLTFNGFFGECSWPLISAPTAAQNVDPAPAGGFWNAR